MDGLPPVWDLKPCSEKWADLLLLQLQVGNAFILSQLTEKKRTILDVQNNPSNRNKSLWD